MSALIYHCVHRTQAKRRGVYQIKKVFIVWQCSSGVISLRKRDCTTRNCSRQANDTSVVKIFSNYYLLHLDTLLASVIMILLPLPVATNATILLTIIMREYFSHFYCILQFEDDFVVRSVSQNGNYYLTSDAQLDATHVNKFDLCLGIVINIRENTQAKFEMFEDFIQKHSKARFQERRYVVMFNSTKDKEFYQFFASNYLKFVSDMLVVKDIPEREGEFALFTHQFVGLENNDKIVLINEWSAISQSFASNSTLYPDKLKNLQGKRLIVGGEKYLPITDPGNIYLPKKNFIKFICLL